MNINALWGEKIGKIILTIPKRSSQLVKADESQKQKKFGTLHEFACHPCAGAMLIFSVSFQF